MGSHLKDSQYVLEALPQPTYYMHNWPQWTIFFFHSYTLCIWDSQTGNVEWQISLQKEKCINFQIKKGKAVTFLKWQILKYNWEQLVFFSFSERKDETELIFQGQIVQNPVFGFSLSIIFLPPKFRKHYTKNKHK